MIITHKLQPMDLTAHGVPQRVDVMQDDKYSRNLQISLYQNGTIWQIPSDVVAVVRYKKSDGKGGNYNTLPDGTTAYEIAGNVITVALAPQVCTTPGLVKLAVGLVRGSAEINTFTVDIAVQCNPGIDVLSEDYFKISGFVPNSGWEPNMYLRTASDGTVVTLPAPDMATNEDIDARTNQYKPIVPNNLEYAVKSVGDGIYAEKSVASKLDALWKLNQGITYKFETDNTPADIKTVIRGAKLASVKQIGGATIVENGALVSAPVQQLIVMSAELTTISTQEIPQAILDLDGYGLGIDKTLYNYVDFENKMYHKMVAIVDLSTLNFNYSTQFNWIAEVPNASFSNTSSEMPKIVCDNYEPMTVGTFNASDSGITTYSTLAGGKAVMVKNGSTTVKPTGYLVYPISYDGFGEDISDILTDDILTNLEVEGGGEILFVKSDGYMVPTSVPNSIEYVVSLAEVNG